MKKKGLHYSVEGLLKFLLMPFKKPIPFTRESFNRYLDEGEALVEKVQKWTVQTDLKINKINEINRLVDQNKRSSSKDRRERIDRLFRELERL